MALIVKSDEFVILSAQRSIFVYNPKDQTHSVVQVPQILRKAHKNSETVDDNNGNDANDGKVDDESNADKDYLEFGDVNRLAISPDNHFVAATTTGDKFLFLYQFADGLLNLLQSHALARATSVLRFTPDSMHLLIGDKTGDCYIHDCRTTANVEPNLILGHLSIVLDVLMTSDLKYVITSDRDEKIRITNYPQTEDIASYCLGHLEFVSAIEQLNDNLLLSLSGDKTVRIWDYLNGKELFRLELSARGLRLVRNSQNHFAIVMFDEGQLKVGLLKLELGESGPTVEVIAEHKLNENVKNISSIVFQTDDSIWLSGQDANNEIVLKRLDITRSNDQTQINETNLDEVSNMLKQNLPSLTLQAFDDVTLLFKKSFDNLSDYHERKKRRIEKENSK